jgi:hypothetical protein
MKKAIMAQLVFVMALAVLATRCKPAISVSVAFRPAVNGGSLVAQIHNKSDATMKLLLEMRSPTTGETRQATLVVPGDGMREFGWAEG